MKDREMVKENIKETWMSTSYISEEIECYLFLWRIRCTRIRDLELIPQVSHVGIEEKEKKQKKNEWSSTHSTDYVERGVTARFYIG